MNRLPTTRLVDMWLADGKQQLYWDIPVELEDDGDCPLTVLWFGRAWERCSGPPQNSGYWYREKIGTEGP